MHSQPLWNLGESVARIVNLAALPRYAMIARLKVDAWWTNASAGIVGAALEDVADGAWDPSAVNVAALRSRVKEALDLVDETPTGALYYPYQALTLVEISADALASSDSEKGLPKLWEYGLRFAKHVDWQLRKSRILSEESFEAREAEIWLHTARLTEDEAGESALFFERSTLLGRRYVESIHAALSSNHRDR